MSTKPANVTATTRQALLSKPVGALGVAVSLIAVAYVVPGADRFRLLSPKPEVEQVAPAASDHASAHVGAAQLADKTEDHPELATPEVVSIPQAPAGMPPLPEAVRDKAPPIPIYDPSGKALDDFFSSLLAVERKTPGSVARVIHYGDSLLAVDYVAGTLRRKLQEHFGDSGHGYMPVANPWPGYFHNDVFRRASTEWTVSRIVGPFAADELYGLGGVTFIGHSRGAWAEFGTNEKGTYGRSASRFGIHVLEQPNGGTIEISIDKGTPTTIDTNATSLGFKEHVLSMPSGAHRIHLAVSKGPTRAFGVWLEDDKPGVVLDSVGIQGARLRFLDQSNDSHWAEALQSRKPALIIFEFGLNESADGYAYPMDRYRETSIAVLQQVRKALPNTSCLVVAPNDVAQKKGTEIVSRTVMPALVQAQKQVSEHVGCAFFDTYEAMGGSGSMATWVRRGLGQPDLTHPTTVGADVIGTWIYRALIDKYANYRERPGS